MNNLTQEVTRLCEEIAGMRDQRAALRSALAQGRGNLKEASSERRASLQGALEEMASKTRTELQDFIGGVKESVTDIRQKVGHLRRDFQADLAGVRQCWGGSNPGSAVQTETINNLLERSSETSPKAKRKKH